MSDLDRIRWDERYHQAQDQVTDRAPHPFLKEVGAMLPERGRVLDVAGGDGRNAIWLAGRGLTATVLDISMVGLRLAEARAESAGLVIATRAVDLETDPLPAGPWDVIVCVAYLHRPLFVAFARVLVPGGLLIAVHPTIRNLERSNRPSERYLLQEGELDRLLVGWDVLLIEEGWSRVPPERHEARCVARKP